MRCPHCQSEELFRSRSATEALSGWKRAVIAKVRCHHCGRLYTRLQRWFGGPKVEDRDRHRPAA